MSRDSTEGRRLRMSKRERIRDLGLIQFDRQLRPEKRVSYDEYNTGEGPQPGHCQVVDPPSPPMP